LAERQDHAPQPGAGDRAELAWSSRSRSRLGATFRARRSLLAAVLCPIPIPTCSTDVALIPHTEKDRVGSKSIDDAAWTIWGGMGGIWTRPVTVRVLVNHSRGRTKPCSLQRLLPLPSRSVALKELPLERDATDLSVVFLWKTSKRYNVRLSTEGLANRPYGPGGMA
jgi:hypothetical protein